MTEKPIITIGDIKKMLKLRDKIGTPHEYEKLFKPYYDSSLKPVYDFSSKKIPNLSEFTPDPDYLYHATNLQALDFMLEDGKMLPVSTLIRQKRLVSGEYFETMGTEACGLQFININAIDLDSLTEIPEDEREKFKNASGHAYMIPFGHSYDETLSYGTKDLTKRAVIGLDKKVCEFNGAMFEDRGSEGIFHKGPLSLVLPLRHIIVPSNRVNEYKEKTKGRYAVQVFPLKENEFE